MKWSTSIGVAVSCALELALVITPRALAQGAAAEQGASEQSGALPAEIGWSQVVPLLRKVSPQRAAIAAQVEVARREVGVAAVLPNPSLSYLGYKRLGHGDQYDTQHQIGLEMPLWLAGQRGARVQAARARAEVARAEAGIADRDLAQSALHAWLALLAAQDRVRVIEAAQQDVAGVSRIVHERVSAGAQSAYDAARVDLESAALDTRHAGAIADQVTASASFAEALGQPQWRPRATGTLEPRALDADFASLWQQAQKRVPELAAAERRSRAAASDVEVARAERWPIPSLSLGTLLTTQARSTALYAGVSVPLPLLDFGGAAIDRSRAELVAAEAERTARVASTRAALASALTKLAATRQTLAGYERNEAARLPGLRGMAEAAYKSGKGNVLELLDSMRTNIDVALQRVELTHDVLEAEIDTLASAGLLEAS